jgi:hypothetical protein
MRPILIPAVLYAAALSICTSPDDTGSTNDTACMEVPWYPDADGDGWGWQDPGQIPTSVWSCDQPSNYSDSAADCDDADPTVYPGAPDPIDGLDTNCDGLDG